MKPRELLRSIVLIAAGSAVFLSGYQALAGIVVGASLWLILRPRPRQALLVLPWLILAGILVALTTGSSAPQRGERMAEAAGRLEDLLEELDAAASAAARTMGSPATGKEARSSAFRALQQLAGEVGDSSADPMAARTWILFDPNGEPDAWAGRGLVHDVAAVAVPREGRLHVGSFTAHTFVSVVPLSDERRPWRVAVGVSLAADRLPGGGARTVHWSPVAAAAGESGSPGGKAGRLQIVGVGVEGDSGDASARRASRQVVVLLVGLGLLLSGIERWQYGRSGWKMSLGLYVFAGGLFAVLALSLSPWLLVPLVGGIALVLSPPAAWPGTSNRAAAAGSVLATLLWVALIWGTVDLVGEYTFQRTVEGVGSGAFFAQVVLFALALGFLRVVRRDGGDEAGEPLRWGLASGIVLLAAAAVHTTLVPAALLLLAGSWLAVAWARRGGWREGIVGAATGLVLAALVTALIWEMAWHRSLESRLDRFVTVELAPPTGVEMRDVAREAERFFASAALEQLSTGDVAALDGDDLAYALWRQSPFAREGFLSAVSVGPSEAPLSTFAYGLPITAEGQIDQSSQLWEALTLPGWEGAVVEGRGSVTLGGGPWTTVEYRLLLRPGFRVGSSVLPTLAEGLLRARSVALPRLRGLPDDLLVGLYSSDGSVLLPPWKGASDLASAVVEPIAEIPGGRARTYSVRDENGQRVVYQPLPSSLQALERIALHASVPLLVLVAGVGIWFLASLGEATRRRALTSGWRSFSKRLVVLYTVLLIVPIVLINVFVLRVFGERLERQQREAGQSALESAQGILGDYVFSLEPGFGIDTAVGDDVLLWLSGVVHHEVNLYWGSRLTASSKRELFSARLLPPRIPGEVFSRIALDGAGLASRTTRAGGAVYEEFYAPLEIPGLRTEDAGLFVSIPLLAQEVAAEQEMAAIRNRVLLAGAAVGILLLLLGRRVGRSFTRPLLQIIEGTQAIASGAPSIGVETTDTEFTTLVEAIDDMAERIAAARADLLREKEVVDRMIDNITSAVVSVDREGRVLLLNRTAHQLLGISSGELLSEALERRERLRPVADFVERSARAAMQVTVRLPGESGEDDEGAEAEWTLVWVPFAGTGEPAGLFVLEDVTEVLRGQRLQAWAEMARMIAHEVKNPLTPIRLSTEHLREIHRRKGPDLDAVLERCTTNILKQVDELQQIVSDFSAYSRIPEINPRAGDLAELVEDVVSGYHSGGPEVSFSKGEGSFEAEFDAKLLARAVRNLLENAVRATGDGGSVRVRADRFGHRFAIRVTDSGGGISSELLPRIFEPYFSTEASGTGLGLPIARRIVEEHGGEISARNVDPPGLEVSILLPAPSTGAG